jgi:hypothetical protein
MTNVPEALSSLVERSIQLHETIHDHVETLVPFDELRFEIAFDSGVLALEHGTAALHLIEAGWTSSAFALMRPQFESLVRGIWLAYGASDLWVDKLSQPLTIAAQKQANEGPMVAEMLKQLEAASNAPAGIVGQLKECRDVSWKALNSFNHGGIHALSKNVTGYSPKLVYDALRNSNAVMALTAQLASIMTGDGRNMDTVRRIHVDYADCLPVINGPFRH